MSESIQIGLMSTLIGMGTVLLLLSLLAVLTYAVGWLDRRFKVVLMTRPVLQDEGIDPKVVAAITAAIAVSERHRFRIHRIRYLSGKHEEWQEMTRAQQVHHAPGKR